MENENENRNRNENGNENSSDSSLVMGGIGGKKNGTPIPDKPLWRSSYDEYKRLATEAMNKILGDGDFISTRERYHPNIDVRKSIEKAFTDFWLLEAGWVHKKKSKGMTIDWPATIINALTMRGNQVQRKQPRVL